MFPTLFSPIDIGATRVKNRVVSTGHDTTLPTDGTVNDALIAYHEARAKGGVGLIVSQVAGVHESARYSAHVLMATDKNCIPGFRRLATTVQQYDCKLFVQLFHPGREIMESDDGSVPVAYSSSSTPSDRFHVIPREMPTGVIAEVVNGYGNAAKFMKQAGVDGVEIVASHGYLLSQFLNSNINRRTDEYGGPFENRLRIFYEVLSAVRTAVGDDFVVGLRISGDEKDHTGLTEADSLQCIEALQTRLDYVSVVAGTSASLAGAIHIVPPMQIENAYVAPFAAMAKARVSIPVIVTGRINQPQEAETILSSAQADMCGMTRALICDPQMPVKAMDERSDDIRACIACNQACIGHFHKGYPISCIQHPETGRELTYGNYELTTEKKNVIVVGGGPGGMKAAITAARRGHHVTLYEAGPRLGGQAQLAQLLPGRSEFGGLITNFTRELELAGVVVKANTRVDADMIETACADAVVIATGAKPRVPPDLEIDEKAHVLDAWQVLQNSAAVGQSTFIADWRCDWVGIGLAEILATAGHRVRLAVNGLHAGELLPFYSRDIAVARLHRLGVEIVPNMRLFGCDEDSVYFLHAANNDPEIMDDVQTLVLAQGHEPDSRLLDTLLQSGIAAIAVGDCLGARSAEEAVLEGLRVGWSL